MRREVLTAAVTLVMVASAPAVTTVLAADGVLELTTRKRSLETIGRVPPRRERKVEVGAMRLGEPDLPAEEMTLQERLILRARKAAQGVREIRARPAVARPTDPAGDGEAGNGRDDAAAPAPVPASAPASGNDRDQDAVQASRPPPGTKLPDGSTVSDVPVASWMADGHKPAVEEGDKPGPQNAYRGALPRKGAPVPDPEQPYVAAPGSDTGSPMRYE